MFFVYKLDLFRFALREKCLDSGLLIISSQIYIREKSLPGF